MNRHNLARRNFLKFLAASPVFAGMAPWQLLAGSPEDIPLDLLTSISAPDEALDVFDFQRLAEKILPPAHYGYLATGTNNNETLRANREAFDQYYLRAMRMVNTSKTDTRLTLLGEELSSPIFIAPVGSQKAFHPEGEEATARAAKAKDHLQILSNVANTSIEDAIAIRGKPVWFQLYPTSDFTVAEKMVRRAEAAGARTLVLTVDLNSGSNRVALDRYARADTRDCTQCHDRDRPDSFFDRTPMYFETQARLENFDTSAMTWDYIAKLRTITSMNIVVKGIVTAEDAAAAVQYGCDAVYVSNHGGRAEA
ncbi:MAG TPA: alpha-hydroxy acid oxidase, partial [Xanthomonadales bacterium]|nr:alpha-hydroxy acid oxidase [Xanthomonadales bacterium]